MAFAHFSKYAYYGLFEATCLTSLKASWEGVPTVSAQQVQVHEPAQPTTAPVLLWQEQAHSLVGAVSGPWAWAAGLLGQTGLVAFLTLPDEAEPGVLTGCLALLIPLPAQLAVGGLCISDLHAPLVLFDMSSHPSSSNPVLVHDRSPPHSPDLSNVRSRHPSWSQGSVPTDCAYCIWVRPLLIVPALCISFSCLSLAWNAFPSPPQASFRPCSAPAS